jgi:hypothetical protein
MAEYKYKTRKRMEEKVKVILLFLWQSLNYIAAKEVVIAMSSSIVSKGIRHICKESA